MRLMVVLRSWERDFWKEKSFIAFYFFKWFFPLCHQYPSLITNYQSSITDMDGKSTGYVSQPTKLAQSDWCPYKRHSDKYVYVPLKAGVGPVFPATGPFTVGGSAGKATLEWGKKLEKKYPDGESTLVNQHLIHMSNLFIKGKSIPTPTVKYAIEAVDGFLIMLQGMKDHGVKF